LNDLLGKTEAQTALIVEKAGYLIHQCGDSNSFDTTTVATLSSNAFNATAFMAGIINETRFTGMFQQGDVVSTLILNIDENCLLVIVFKASLGVGAVKYYAATTIEKVAHQLEIASAREPGKGFDIISLNPDDVSLLFKRKEPGEDAPPALAAEPAPAAEPIPEAIPEPGPEASVELAPPPAAPLSSGSAPEAMVSEPIVCAKEPIVETVYPGIHFWCACGRSKIQPYCDGSHAGTGLKPIKVEIKETKEITWCACKLSGTKPYCDGTHTTLS
jgi:CDGSH-type Zn-finger protein/predicted regulator of Ras-like GTPase activity (Roadblock/LC7/MglB family)